MKILENGRQCSGVRKLNIRASRQSGIDTRVSGITNYKCHINCIERQVFRHWINKNCACSIFHIWGECQAFISLDVNVVRVNNRG